MGWDAGWGAGWDGCARTEGDGRVAVAKGDVIRALNRARLSGSERGAIAQGLVQDVVVDGDRVQVFLFDQVGGAPVPQAWVEALRNAVSALPGVARAEVEARPAGAVPQQRTAGRARPTVEVGAATAVLAVASGKGGVGKSTVTANLCVALAELGHRVAAVDADIYGFSLPSILGSRAQPEVADGRIRPVDAHGVELMSMDFFIRGNQPVVWRGPMLGKALQQFLTDVDWAEPDFLLLDLPPGTGDVALDVHELLPSSCEVVVTTPDPVAARVAVRAGQMAQKTNHEVLGVVENMSYLPCDRGSEPHVPFGRGGGETVARELGVPLLGRLPLGSPTRPGTGLFTPDSEAGRLFRELAQEIAARAG
jgi:ATP-binding protein involved in chromosome partitioning